MLSRTTTVLLIDPNGDEREYWKERLNSSILYYKVFEADDGKTGLDVVGRNIEVAETMKQIDAASRSGATHEGSPAGGLTRVLSPDDVMGDTVWAEEEASD